LRFVIDQQVEDIEMPENLRLKDQVTGQLKDQLLLPGLPLDQASRQLGPGHQQALLSNLLWQQSRLTGKIMCIRIETGISTVRTRVTGNNAIAVPGKTQLIDLFQIQ